MEIKVNPPEQMPVDPRIKPSCYMILAKLNENKIIGNFELYDNHVVWEFPLPVVLSSYHHRESVSLDKIIGTPHVVFAELLAKVYAEISKMGGRIP